jgi:coenzyme F420 biosynthesis associated uncharacterized protein
MSERLIDWRLAQRVALAIAGQGPRWEGEGEAELRRESERAVELVSEYTRLEPAGELPPAELVGRDEWVRTNLATFRQLSAIVERSLAQRLSLPGPAGGAAGAVAALVTGLEVGLVTGYLAQRVIGQYDVGLIGPARPPRLLFVAPNLAAARSRLDVDRTLFLRWVALHEATHALQFAAVPWLRDHVGGIATELLEGATLEIRPGALLEGLRGMTLDRLVSSLRTGDLMSLLLSDERRRLVEGLKATMTVVEGYAEHAMDAVGARLDPRYAELRRRLERDRERRGALESLVSRLLGLDVKLAQYRRGKAFCDRVAASAGIETLNRVWDDERSLPRSEELDRPDAWLQRAAGAAAHV